MLARGNRLKKDKDFRKVFRIGKTVKDGQFAIRFIGNDQNMTRFGFVVGLKLAKKAVVRNAVRRQFSEAVRRLLGQIKPGYDIVIMPKDAAVAKIEILCRQLTESFKRAGILKNG